MRSEKDPLHSEKKYRFRGLVDKLVFSGPVFARGEGSTIEDMNGKCYIDFNSGQMFSALGHNHPHHHGGHPNNLRQPHPHAQQFLQRPGNSSRRVPWRATARVAREKPFSRLRSGQKRSPGTIDRKFTGGFEVSSPHISFHDLSDTARAFILTTGGDRPSERSRSRLVTRLRLDSSTPLD